MRLLLAALLAVSLNGAALAQAVQRELPQSRGDVILSFSPVVKKAQPSVVNVYASHVEPRGQRNALLDDPIFRRFFGGGQQGGRPGGTTAQSLGSGVIVDASGLVVTNHHVIEGMNEVKVALADKREVEADIVLRDPRTDLAVLKLRGTGPFPAMEMGDSEALEVGDMVLALGNPFAVGQTVTQGIVSALARTQIGVTDYQFFIQTDAAINPGNSGGALVDMRARLVGINSSIYSQSGGSIGIGFAVPVNTVKIVVAAAKGGVQQVRRPWFGATLQVVSRDIADGLGLDRPTGAIVSNVTDNSPASAAGVRRGDVITAIDGQSVDDPDSFGYRLGTKPVGGTASITALRGGKPIILPIKLVVAPETPPRDQVVLKNRSPFSGTTVVNYSPAVAEELSIQQAHEGVAVADVEDGSPAAFVGLAKGDVILSVNDTKIGSTRDLERLSSARQIYWKLKLVRAGEVIDTVIGG